jgi:hypothetical protein
VNILTNDSLDFYLQLVHTDVWFKNMDVICTVLSNSFWTGHEIILLLLA